MRVVVLEKLTYDHREHDVDDVIEMPEVHMKMLSMTGKVRQVEEKEQEQETETKPEEDNKPRRQRNRYDHRSMRAKE